MHNARNKQSNYIIKTILISESKETRKKKAAIVSSVSLYGISFVSYEDRSKCIDSHKKDKSQQIIR